MYFISIPDAVIIEVFSFFYFGGGAGRAGAKWTFFLEQKKWRKRYSLKPDKIFWSPKLTGGFADALVLFQKGHLFQVPTFH